MPSTKPVIIQEGPFNIVLKPNGVKYTFVVLFTFALMLYAEEDLQVRWLKLRIKLKEKFEIKPDMNGVLLLIGVQELGQGAHEFSKEQKQDLMHIAICTILSASGYYTLDGLDDEGWPHFTQLKALPEFNTFEQENFLKDHVLLYFQSLGFL